jgi:hypothetical protein
LIADTDNMPHPDAIPAGISDLLIQVGSRMEMLDQDREALKSLDWINRLWRGTWENTAQALAQDACEFLIRGLVIVERELDWLGGSVSAAIWVFRVYEERFAPSHIEVADWVLQNRGRNPYLPFGSQTVARNYDGYLAERQVAGQRYSDHLDRQSEEKQEKERREKKRFENYVARIEDGKERAARVRKFNADLASISISERLTLIAGSGMPLEAVSNDLLVEAPDAVTSIDPETKSKLTQIINRRNRGSWGRIRRALEIK